MLKGIIEVVAINNHGIKDMPEMLYQPKIGGEKVSVMAETADVAFLLGIERKYIGTNSQFTKFACRMLGIDTVWAE